MKQSELSVAIKELRAFIDQANNSIASMTRWLDAFDRTRDSDDFEGIAGCFVSLRNAGADGWDKSSFLARVLREMDAVGSMPKTND